MTGRRLLFLKTIPKTLAAAAALLAFHVPHVARAGVLCPGGRFVVEGDALLRGAEGAGPDAVVLTQSFVSIESGCTATAVSLRAGRQGTVVRAAFPECREPGRRFVLKGRLDPSCATLQGTFGPARREPRRHFTARLSTPEDVAFAAETAGSPAAFPGGNAVRTPGANGDAHGKRGHSRAVCHGPGARCRAHIATDENGIPLVASSPANTTVGMSLNGFTWGYSPQNFHTAYGLPWRSTVRQTIAVIDAFDHPNAKPDLDTFNAAFGLGYFPSCSSTITTGCFQRVDQNGNARGFQNNNADLARAWDIETNLDVQAAHGMCLNCKILLVEAYDQGGLEAANNTAARLGATVISNSWGISEAKLQTWNPSAFIHPGIAITVSTGDLGYESNYPADLNSVIAVGGTTLSMNSDGSYNSESVWGDGFNAPIGDGAGSGCSTFTSIYTNAPTWQRSLTNWTATGCGGNRAIADVAADADPYTGAWVYNSVPNKYGQTGWFRIGGTSLSAPIIAGVYALAGNAGSVSWPGQIPYQHRSQFHDVATGSNGLCINSIMCNGGIGYDGPTGVGTPWGIGGF